MGVLWGYLFGAGLMIVAGVVAAFLALPAERRSLEEIALMSDVAPGGPPLGAGSRR